MVSTVGVFVGYFLVFLGVSLLVKFRELPGLIEEILDFRSLFYTLCGLYATAGLLLITIHNRWTWEPQLLLTLLGWALFLEGLIYCLLPFSVVRNWVRKFTTQLWWIAAGLASAALGVSFVGIFG